MVPLILNILIGRDASQCLNLCSLWITIAFSSLVCQLFPICEGASTPDVAFRGCHEDHLLYHSALITYSNPLTSSSDLLFKTSLHCSGQVDVKFRPLTVRPPRIWVRGQSRAGPHAALIKYQKEVTGVCLEFYVIQLALFLVKDVFIYTLPTI